MDSADSAMAAAAAAYGAQPQPQQQEQRQEQRLRTSIRDAAPADADALAEIAVAAWQPIRRRQAQTLGPEQFAMKFPDWESAKAATVRQTCGAGFEGSVLVATLVDADRDSPVVVGFVSFGEHDWREPDPARRRPVGEIWNNAVRPQFQQQGIGSRLYAAALGRMAAAGMQSVLVGVGVDNVPACRAYEKVGFRRVAPGDSYCRCDITDHGLNSEPEGAPTHAL